MGYFVSEFHGRHTRGDRSLQQVTVTTPLFEQAILVPATYPTNSYWFELKGQVAGKFEEDEDMSWSYCEKENSFEM